MASSKTRRSGNRNAEAGGGISPSLRYQLRDDRSAGRHERVLEQAERLIADGVVSAEVHAWVAQARHRLGDPEGARQAFEAALSLAPEDPDSLNQMGEALLDQGEAREARQFLEQAMERRPGNLVTEFIMSRVLHAIGEFTEALELCDCCLRQTPEEPEVLKWRAVLLTALRREVEAQEALQKVLAVKPRDFGANNNLASLYLYQTDYDKAEHHYQIAQEVNPDADQPVSNLLASRHYNPRYSAEELFRDLVARGKALRPVEPVPRADTEREPGKRLRIGLLSGGFRTHPVGQMILPAIEALDARMFELIAYSTNQVEDRLTSRFQARVDAWCSIGHLNNDQLDARIREDGIDILIDMNGLGDGSRYKALVQEPAPLMVKWVGALSNTTGLECFDYLISDHIETPEGADERYVEKLIRLPDDYICYQVPDYTPEHSALPALTNGHITFGCLNNPAKLSPELLEAWAVLMNEVPESRLLLRGKQFDGPAFCDKIRASMAAHGIAPSRLILEGPTDHRDFLATYHRIDIALDTWPYSGGLTTCEALLMGVPVVTRTGPTFAGRHSATHLINAGLKELVTDNWDDYRGKVKELISDLPNLAVIRAALRTVLKDSPVCDGERFARHLTSALRAIWTRHCEGKPPAALSFEKDGRLRFDAEKALPTFSLDPAPGAFDWALASPVVVVDNGACLASRSGVEWPLGRGEVAMLVFDPPERLEAGGHLSHYGEFQYFPQVSLGSGQPVTLYVGEASREAHSLKPLGGSQELAQQPVPTIALDSIEGLASIDLLTLDDRHDNFEILEHGYTALKDTLVLQARVRFNPLYQGQTGLSELTEWASGHGFRFYKFHDADYHNNFPDLQGLGEYPGTELTGADAIFIPDNQRLGKLSRDDKIKLAYILDTFYQARDAACAMLHLDDEKRAERYLVSLQMREATESSFKDASLDADVLEELDLDLESLNL